MAMNDRPGVAKTPASLDGGRCTNFSKDLACPTERESRSSYATTGDSRLGSLAGRSDVVRQISDPHPLGRHRHMPCAVSFSMSRSLAMICSTRCFFTGTKGLLRSHQKRLEPQTRTDLREKHRPILGGRAVRKRLSAILDYLRL